MQKQLAPDCGHGIRSAKNENLLRSGWLLWNVSGGLQKYVLAVFLSPPLALLQRSVLRALKNHAFTRHNKPAENRRLVVYAM